MTQNAETSAANIAQDADSEYGPAVVDVAWLAEHLNDPNVTVIDATMGAAPTSPRIPGARWFDHDTAMAQPGSDLPHTLPDMPLFQEQVRRLGINDDAHVVIYDGPGIFSSPRARWMLTRAGHRNVSVLDGGLPEWVGAGHATEEWPEGEDPREAAVPGDFTATGEFGSFVATAARVLEALDEDGVTVVDARSGERFRGEVPEPRPGLRVGHMLGAVSVPFTDLLVGGRTLRPLDELREVLDAAIPAGNRVIASCGSGVTASVVLFALELLGRDGVVYDGSWSEWGRPGGGPVVTGEA